ncbi:MAG: protein-L-isoaspartate(D-aspartate) O-methyltransferase [Planctomycetaceae bacterium]|nr:protein-L-isoaspartate(D-aspartate) O-methyltransferase [Planctomycetaceae bacterium]
MWQTNEKDKLARQRQAMIQTQLKARGISNPAVLQVVGEIPREIFIPAQLRPQSYDDNPLPIGHGQTISQPYIVALMTQELKIDKQCDILEIGTGSGYQTAILAALGKRVYTIERIEQHSADAVERLKKLNITNVDFAIGDGTCGWSDDIKFDRIIITAAAPKMPEPLAEQLKIGGLAIVPIGEEIVQEFVLLEKTATGFKSKNICGCRFVKLIGKHGFAEQ